MSFHSAYTLYAFYHSASVEASSSFSFTPNPFKIFIVKQMNFYWQRKKKEIKFKALFCVTMSSDLSCFKYSSLNSQKKNAAFANIAPWISNNLIRKLFKYSLVKQEAQECLVLWKEMIFWYVYLLTKFHSILIEWICPFYVRTVCDNKSLRCKVIWWLILMR